MIKCSMGKEMSISGNIVLIAAELEDILRSVRTAFCDAVGEKIGNKFLDECIKNSKLSVEEVERKGELAAEEMRKSDPMSAASVEAQIEEILKRL